MKRKLIVAAALAAVFSAAAFAQGGYGGYGPGYGMGPGMMGGYGGYGPGYGMGPGMMGGYGGYGPGYGMGPGMMGGYGGYGPGYGMGPGMMWGYGGGYGMGPGMMWGYGPGRYGYGIPNFTSEQRAKLAEIQNEFRNKQWALMQSMHELAWKQGDVYRDGKLDEQAARKAFDAMTDLRKQMFENSLEARKRMDSVLTAEQRKELSGAGVGGSR